MTCGNAAEQKESNWQKDRFEMKTSTLFPRFMLALLIGIVPATMFAQHPGAPAQTPGSQPGNNSRMQQPMPDQTSTSSTQTDTGSNKMMKSSDARFAMKAAQGDRKSVV